MELPAVAAAFAAAAGAVLAILGWREQHARPKVAPWIGHWRTKENDAGSMIIECRFSNRGHDRELVQLFLEFRKGGALIEQTDWKGPFTIRAGSTQITRVPLDAIYRKVRWYIPGANVDRIVEVMLNMKVMYATGDGALHTAKLDKHNRQRLEKWVREQPAA